MRASIIVRVRHTEDHPRSWSRGRWSTSEGTIDKRCSPCHEVTRPPCRSFFARKFQRIVEAELARRAARQMHMPVDVKLEPWWKRAWKLLRLPWKSRLRSLSDVAVQEVGQRGRYQLRPDMIRRVEGAPKLVDPSGWISEGVSEQRVGNHASPDGNAKENEGESGSGANTELTEMEHKREGSGTPEQEPYVLYANARRY